MSRAGLKFGHLGLFAHDLDRMADFYSRVLEFTVTDPIDMDRSEHENPGDRRAS